MVIGDSFVWRKGCNIKNLAIFTFYMESATNAHFRDEVRTNISNVKPTNVDQAARNIDLAWYQSEGQIVPSTSLLSRDIFWKSTRDICARLGSSMMLILGSIVEF